MAFLFPRVAFTPAHCYQARPTRPQPSFAPFLSLVEDVINEAQRESKRQVQRARQQRRRFNPRFDVWEDEASYNIDAEVPGFGQENIEIEVADEHTLNIKGGVEKRATTQSEAETSAAATESQPEPEPMQVEQSKQAEPERAASPAASETSSVKSYKATVEDDFEDLGADSDVASTSHTVSNSSTPEQTTEAEKPATTATETAVEKSESAVEKKEVEAQQPHQWLSERSLGSFERSFRFAARIDRDAVKASMKNGVLNIKVPKAPVPEVRHIEIQ